jgi:hypothetical protein
LTLAAANGGATKTYSGSPLWSATMYTLPNHAAGSMSSSGTITAGTPTTVTVAYASGALGSPVSSSNVYIRIGTGMSAEEFQATGTVTGGTVSATVTANNAGTNLAVAIVVKYPSETGVTGDVRVSTSSSTITVAAASYLLEASTMDRNPSKEWSGNTAGTANWGITVAASKFKEYQPDLAGEFALAAKASAMTGMMFRGLGSAWTPTAVSQNNIKYLVIVENDAVASGAATVTSAVKWTATYSGKTITVPASGTSNKGAFQGDSKYLTSFGLSGGAANSDFAVYVNGQAVTVGSATSIGPFTQAKGLKAAGYSLPDGVLGGLCYTDYVMHVVFASPVTLSITGFNVGPASTDSGLA